MSVSEDSSRDGVVFARSIRSVAQKAGELLQGPAADGEIYDLLSRIDCLAEEARNRQSDELGRWLASLRRLVEEQMMVTI